MGYSPKSSKPRAGHALAAEGVSKRYRGQTRWALRDVTLELATGTLTALVGPNGAGKSTLIKCWLGFERPTAGRVWIHGLDPAEDRGHALSSVAYVAQSAGLYRPLSVRDHIAMATALRPKFKAALTEDRLHGLDIPLTAEVRNLSGGQQAQVALALALGTEAPTLILDEPLASLDPIARREFMTVLLSVVSQQDRTAVLSSHVIADVADVCDRTIVLVDGRVAVDLDRQAIATSYRVVSEEHAALPAAELIGSFPTVRGDLVSLARTTAQIGSLATSEEVVMGYLARSRLGSERAVANEAER